MPNTDPNLNPVSEQFSESLTTANDTIISAASARRAARLFDIGNIVSMLLPFPLGIFWLGLSMVVYAMNRCHPNQKVAFYTQQAAYRFYGISGFVIVVAIFFGTNFYYWLVTWALCATILIPWSIINLIKIQYDQWLDVIYNEADYE